MMLLYVKQASLNYKHTPALLIIIAFLYILRNLETRLRYICTYTHTHTHSADVDVDVDAI